MRSLFLFVLAVSQAIAKDDLCGGDIGVPVMGIMAFGSPNYPSSSPYPANTICYFKITTEPGYRITLRTVDFAWKSSDCISDKLKFFEKINGANVSLGSSICKKSDLMGLQSTTNQVIAVLQTDSQDEFLSFRISVQGLPLQHNLLIGNDFNLSDSISLAVSTKRQRNQVLEQITSIWQAALQPNVTNVHISTLRDVPGFPVPKTVDGRPIRTVTYLLQGTGSGVPIDLNLAAQRFRQLLPGAGIPAVSAANPDMTTPSPSSTSTSRNAPPFVVFFDKTLVNGTTFLPNSSSINVQFSTDSTVSRSPNGEIITQIVPVQSSAATAGTTTPFSSSNTTQLAPTLLSTPPILIGPGPFILNDTIVITADTRRSRDRVLEEQIRPIWQNVLGGNVTSFQLGVVWDFAFSTPQTPGGINIRQIQYQVQGVAKTAVDSEAAKQQFRQAILANAPHNIWAVSNHNGSVILLPDSSNETSSTTVAAAVVVPAIVSLTNSTISSATASFALLELHPATTSASAGQYLGSLAMRNYNPSDQEAVVQILQQLWTQALETNDNNVHVQYLPTSGNSSVLGTDGSSLFDLQYAFFIQPNVTRPDVVWSRFLSLLRQSDLMDYILELPAQVPLNAASTTPSSLLSSSTVAVIPILSFTENQHIAIKDPSDVGSVADGLRILWANASGINASSSEIRIISLTPLDPPKSSSTGLPVRTLTYGVTLQNVTDLPSVRARAEALVPTSSLKEYLVLPEQQTVNITSSTTKSSVILLVPARTAQTTTSQLLASRTLTPVLPGVLGGPQTAHSLRIAVFNATDLDQLTNGIRNSWITTLDMQAQSQVVSITLTNVQPENVATQAGVPISTLFYDLQVPPNLQIGPDQEAAFLRFLLQSPARQYVLTNVGSTLNPAMVGMLSENVMVPFSIGDTVILATNSHINRDRILGQVKKTWDAALATSASDVRLKMVNDLSFTTPTKPDGVPVRSISYEINGHSDGLVDEYDAKSRFRQLAKTSPISGVWSIPDLPAAATTLSELPSEVVVLTAAATTTAVQPATVENWIVAGLSSSSRTLTSTSNFQVGDHVRIVSDAALIKILQKGHGGWFSSMLTALGQIGRVEEIDDEGDLRIAVSGTSWSFNPLSVTSLAAS